MRILLGLIGLALWAQAVSAANVLRPPSLARPQGLVLQSFSNIAELQREVDMLVARGYVLFAGEFRNEKLEGVTGKEFVLIRDTDSPVYRYGEDEIAVVGSPRNFKTRGIAEGGRATLGGDGKDVNVGSFIYIPRNASDAERSHLGWYHYRLETADGSYPQNPAVIDTLKLVTAARTVELQPVNNYRVYRGQLDWPKLPGGGHTRFIETITINGDNPYIVYRHTERLYVDYHKDNPTTVEATRLSIGIYPHVAINPYAIGEYATLGEGTGILVKDNGLYRYQLNSDNKGNKTLKFGEQEIPLQLVKDSEVWNEYEGDIGITGAEIESKLERRYFNGESSN